ncbi:protocatechuate 3,4-dioxygenase subunit alpha [soil metagenome]
MSDQAIDAKGDEVTEEYVQTPSQTIGPFFAYALPYEGGRSLLPAHAPGTIRLHGTVTDGAGEPVPDALIEIWQADANGEVPRELGSRHRDGYTFTGFGRDETTLAGTYSFTTVRPGAVGPSAPFVLVTVFARGLLRHLFTRAYFPEDIAAHQTDTVLSSLAADRRATLVSARDAVDSYRFDIRLQGEGETVFLSYD